MSNEGLDAVLLILAFVSGAVASGSIIWLRCRTTIFQLRLQLAERRPFTERRP